MKKILTYAFSMVALFGFAGSILAASYAGPTPGPILHTDYPTDITSSGATLNATILGHMDIYNSTGQTTHFEYGTSESNLNLTSTSTGPVQGTVSTHVNNLTPNTTYYFRIVINSGPNSNPPYYKQYGGVLTFTTGSIETDPVINCIQAPCGPFPEPSTTPVVTNTTTTNTNTTTTTTTTNTNTNTNAEPYTEVIETPSIAGCGNRTTGFSATTGQSCVGNVVTTTFYGTHINNQNQNNVSNTNTTTTNTTTTNTTVNQNSAISLARRIAINLTMASRGASVSALQNFLIEQDKGPAARALAQVGATGYFGILTRTALAEFQASAGITPSVGYFGPITRAYINAQY